MTDCRLLHVEIYNAMFNTNHFSGVGTVINLPNRLSHMFAWCFFICSAFSTSPLMVVTPSINISVLKPRWNATCSVSKILAVEILKNKSYSNSNSSPVCPLITRLPTLHVFQCHSDNASPLTSVDLTTNIKLFALA